jgi:secondary thiamine-phosphate synthase enzyme
MKLYTSVIEVPTQRERDAIDVTDRVREEVASAEVEEGLCALYAQGATAALMIQENDDPNVAEDILDCLDGLIPGGRWRHDRVDNNGAAHIQAGLVGPSETIPVRGGRLALSTWQNVFLFDFDGPRQRRRVLVTITGE